MLEHIKRMHHMDQAGFNIGASITAILPMAQVVYIGDDDGRVVSCCSHFERPSANEGSMNGIASKDNDRRG